MSTIPRRRHIDRYAHLRQQADDRGHYKRDGVPKQPLGQVQAEGAALALRARGDDVHAYVCWCGSWHVGHVPGGTRCP